MNARATGSATTKAAAYPTATTVADLLGRARQVTKELQRCTDPLSLEQWESFDQALYRLLVELAGARALGPGPVDRDAVPHYDIVKGYPTPLAPASPTATEFTAAEAARLTGTNRRTMGARIFRGELPAHRTNDGWLIPREGLNLRTVPPADAGDPHPLVKLAVTFGALTDVLHGHHQDPDKPILATGSVNRLAHDVLDLTVPATRQAMTLMALSDTERPLAIARHAESARDRLAPRAVDEPLPYAAIPPPPRQRRLPDVLGSPQAPANAEVTGRLDRALADWVGAAKAEVARVVPSTDVIRNVTAQGIHVYAAIDALATESADRLSASGSRGIPTQREQLRDAAQTLQRAATSWGSATTGMRPGHDYVDAAQRLQDVLEDVINLAPRLDRELTASTRYRLLDSLTAASHDLTVMLRESAPIAKRLIDAGALLAPARTLRSTDDRLHAKAKGRFVAVRFNDVPDLIEATIAAEIAARSVAPALPKSPTPPPTHDAPHFAGPQL